MGRVGIVTHAGYLCPRLSICFFPVMVEENSLHQCYLNLLSMSEIHPSTLYFRASARLPAFFICLLIR